MAKNLDLCYLLDFYGEVLTERQREVMEQYYNDDLSLSEIAENFGITRQGVRDAIKHGEGTLLDLEAKVGFAARYRRMQEILSRMEQLLHEAKFANAGSYGGLSTVQVNRLLESLLAEVTALREADGEA